MVAQLVKMGMPADVIKSLTPDQKAKMFELTKDPAIVAKAAERVAASATNEEIRTLGVEGRSVDGSFAKALKGDYSWKDEKEAAHVRVPLADTGNSGTDGVEVEILAKSLAVTLRGAVVMKGPLFQEVDARVSTWSVEEGGAGGGATVTLKLVKAKPMRWLQVLRS